MVLEKHTKETKLKKDEIERTSKILDEEFVDFLEKAGQENEMAYVSKAYGLKKKRKEVKTEFEKL